jgi:signal transduction histidine kinase
MQPNAPNHRIVLGLSEALPSFSGDRDRVTQVVANLLSNAVKYSPTGGEIAVGTAVEGADLHLTVADQGMGIPADMLHSIWERYSRVDSDAARGIQGTGLGLPIVLQIAQLHGGRAWAESELGRGSVFHVLLPIAASSQAVEA